MLTANLEPTLSVDDISPLVQVRAAENNSKWRAKDLRDTSPFTSRRRQARRELERAGAALDEARQVVADTDWEPSARSLVLQAFERDHRDANTGRHWLNPYHLRSLATLEAASVRISGWLPAASVARSRDVVSSSTTRVPLGDCSRWGELCGDPRWIRNVVAAEIAYCDSKASDTRIDHSPVSGYDHVTVQHHATGLRIRMQPDPSGIGTIEGRSYHIASLTPGDTDGGMGWERWAGLGIGTRLYAFGAALLPAQRWGTSSTKPAGYGVRAKLHPSDAYRWQANCGWCVQNGIAWVSATPGSLAAHP